MRVALCTRNPDNPVIAALHGALRDDGIDATVIDDPRVVLEDASFDAGYWRPDARDAQVAAYSRQAAILLEGLGVPFLNSLASMERAASKVVSAGLFAAAGVSVPKWWIAPRAGGRAEAIPPGPKIVKPVWGKRSRGVTWCRDVDAALARARDLAAPCILQRPVVWRRQLRCVVAPAGLVRVYAQENAEPGRASIQRFDRSRPGTLERPPDGASAMAEAMLGAIGGDLMRADLLEDFDGRLWALEINAGFGFPHEDPLVLGAFGSGFRRIARPAAADQNRSSSWSPSSSRNPLP